MEAISVTNPVFRAFVFWSMILIFKMLLMSTLTARKRFANKVFANPEDTFNKKKPIFNDAEVERVRRAHKNDLENVFPFITVAFFYVLISPEASLAINLIRVAAVSRIVHTLVYAIKPMQPHRAISFFTTYGITAYMGYQVLAAVF